MSKKGCCWDNAVAEIFFGSWKQERVHWRNYRTRYAAQQDVLNYITIRRLIEVRARASESSIKKSDNKDYRIFADSKDRSTDQLTFFVLPLN
jgi:transposase InsO family protein